MGEFEWFRMLMESVRWHDGWGTASRIFSYLFVEIPFAFQRLVVSIIALMMRMLDFSSLFAEHRRIAFDHSREIWLSFIGGGNGYISNKSVAFFFVLIATIYLTWHFFLSRKGDFAKKAGHMLMVAVLGFAYFGSWTVDGESTPGGIVMFDTLDNVSAEIRSAMLTDFSPPGMTGVGVITSETDFATFYQAHIIGTTFNFINSGSITGEYAPGQRLDMDRLIPPPNMSSGQERAWERARDNYIDNLANVNPWVRADMSLIVPRAMMVALGLVNGIILAIPIIYVNLTMTGFEIINWLLILFFPFLLMISFIPFLRGVVFKVLKMMVVVSFVPVLLGFLILIFFYLNQVLDAMILEMARLVLGSGSMNNGIEGLAVFSVMVTVKVFVFWGAWKNKKAFLSFITAGAITPHMTAMVDAPTEMMKEYGKKPIDYVEEKYEAVKKAAAGAVTGDVEAVDEGIGDLTGDNQDDQTMDGAESEEDQTKMDEAAVDDESFQMPEHDVLTDAFEAPHDLMSVDDIARVHVVNSDEMTDGTYLNIEALADVENVDMFEAVGVDKQTRLNGEIMSHDGQMVETSNAFSTVYESELNTQIAGRDVGALDDVVTDGVTRLNGEVVHRYDEPELGAKTASELYAENMDRFRDNTY